MNTIVEGHILECINKHGDDTVMRKFKYVLIIILMEEKGRFTYEEPSNLVHNVICKNFFCKVLHVPSSNSLQTTFKNYLCKVPWV